MVMRKGLAGFLVLVIVSVATCAHATLDVHFINVGHGDAILIDCGDWEALVDSGPGSRASNEAVLAVLAAQVDDGILELAILSHPHGDHYGGFAAVFSQYEVWEFWRSFDTEPDTDEPAYVYFLKALATEGLIPRSLERGDRMMMEGVDWVILGPGELSTNAENDAENSLVFVLIYEDVRLLFVGDIEASSELALLDIDLPAGRLILKLPHHGLAGSTSSEFLAWADPELAIVSCDEDDMHETTIANLGQSDVLYLTTYADGTISVSTDGESIWISTDTLSGQAMAGDD